MVLDNGAASNLPCFRASGNRNLLSGRTGARRVSTFPACVCFKFGDGRLGDVRFAAYSPAGIAGCRGTLAAFALVADIPAILRRVAVGALGGSWIALLMSRLFGNRLRIFPSRYIRWDITS